MTVKDIIELQTKLSDLIGVPGHEEPIAELIIQEVTPLVDKIWTDPLGNVLAIKEGLKGENRILLDAHMDEVGLMVSHVEPNGFLRFVLLGGWDTRTLLSQSVVLLNDKGEVYHGVIGAKPPHILTAEERTKPVQPHEMYIDVGLRSEGEVVDNGIHVGSVGTLHDPVVVFPNNMLRARALDDRLGCNLIIQLLRRLKNEKIDDTLVINFAVQEEVGARGGKTGAYTLEPTMALALETTTGADVPDVKDPMCPTKVGDGPALTVADRSMVASPKVLARLRKNAELKGIKYQYKKPASGGTDAGQIHLSRGGVPSGVVSVPCRYLHSPVSMASMDDAMAVLELVEAFVRNPASV